MAQKYNLPDGYKGDTYQANQFTITLNGVVLDLTGSSIKIQFRKEKKTGAAVKTITDGSGITITNPTGGVFVIDKFDMIFVPNLYYYDIQITDSSGDIFTYVFGTLNVVQDVTT